MLLDIHNVSKSFSSQSGSFFFREGRIQAVDDIRLGIPEGSFFGLFGAYGSGKTTLLKMIEKEIKPDSGNIFFENEDIFLHSKSEDHVYRQKVCSITADSFLVCFREKNIGRALEKELDLYFPDQDSIEKKISIRNICDDLEIPLSLLQKNILDCSLEESIRLSLARVFLLGARLIVFDDPLADLPIASQEDILSFLLQQQDKSPISYLYATQRSAVLQEICTHCAFLQKGRIVLAEADV